MDSGLIELLKGGPSMVVMGILLLAVVLALTHFVPAWVRLWEARQDRKRAAFDLKRHPFFSRLRYVLKDRVRNLPISDPMRKEAFQDLLCIKCSVWHDETMRLLDREDLHEIKGADLRDVLLAYASQVINTYEREAMNRGIPVIVICKFQEWHRNACAEFMRYIENVCDSDWIPDNESRMSSVLFILLGLLEHTIYDAEGTLADINGQLDGLTYKGFVAQPWESPKRIRARGKTDPVK